MGADLHFDVVQVSRQLGHANPAVRLSIYSHLFNRQAGAEAKAAFPRDELRTARSLS